MASTLNMPPKERAGQANDDVILSGGQEKPTMHRYRLQVDRQTKDSFKDKAVAITKGKAIKKAHPVVQVIIYDWDTHERTPVAGD